MPSSDATTPNYSRRIILLAVFIVVLFGGYSLGWFYVADRVREKIDTIVANLDKAGIAVDCANAEVRGYPFRIGVFCDDLDYGDERRGVFATAGSLRSAAQIYQPMHAVAELDPPLRLTVPGVVPLWLDWDNLRSSVRIATPLPERLSVEVEGMSGQTDPQDDSETVSLFSAGNAQAHVRPNGADLDVAFSFSELEIDPEAVAGRALPVMAGSGDATVKEGLAALRSPRPGLRGRSFDIRSLDLSSGTAGISVSGPVSVDANGLVDATLTIRVRDPKTAATLLATAFPEQKDNIQAGFAGLAVLGGDAALPLRIDKGKMTLGFIPLGRIEAMR